MSALLFVFSEPGPNLPLEEYSDWYDNEHVALRVPLRGFINARRLIKWPESKPNWGAVYDITSLDYFKEKEYTRLRDERSDREKSVIKRLETFDRRIYKLVFTKSSVPDEDAESIKPFTWLAVGMQPTTESEGDFNNWYEEEHIPLLSKVPGWIRSRRYELVEGGEKGKTPKYFALHEFSTDDWADTEEFKAATNTPWRDKVMKNVVARERSEFKLYKQYK